MIGRIALAAFLILPIGQALAQNGGSEIVIPPAPPLTAELPAAPAPEQPAPPPPPGLVQSAPPVLATPGAAPSGPPPTTAPALTQPPPPDIAPVRSSDWTPGTMAVLAVLNKVDGSTATLRVPVGGGPQADGDLTISVQACVGRPIGQIPDAAAFLTVSPTAQGAVPLYRGWLLRSAPGASFVGNAGQAFRVVSCS